MKNNKYNLLSLIILIMFVSSCYKDSDFENETSTTTYNPEVLSEINGSILGYVYDENNNPVANASVQIYSEGTTTDSYGVFTFENVNLDQHGTYLTVTHPDFMLGSDRVYVKSGIGQSRIQMISMSQSENFNAEEGGEINVRLGGKIFFEPNSIADKNGDDYQGMVEVSARLISADDEKLGEVMPGSLLAQDKEGKTVVLGTAGMMAVELRTPAGEELNLIEGRTAEIHLPVSSNSMPNEIATWSFNEVTGRWQEEGSAILNNGNYEFKVGHFSFWNCDYPFELVSVSGRVLDTDGNPVQTKVGVLSERYGVEYAHTDSDGFFSGKVPAGEVLEFYIYGYFCSNKTFRISLGPFDATTVLNDFIIDRSLVPNINGQVVCSGAPYANATIIVEAEGQRYIYNVLNNDGTFSYNPNLICDDITTGSIWAYDNATQTASPIYPLDFENPIMPILDVCEVVCDFQPELIYNCGDPQIIVNILNPDGTYTYAWDTGDTNSTFNLPSTANALYCLTITEDITGCEEVLCQEVGRLRFNLYSDACYGGVDVQFTQGTPPYDILVVETGETYTTTYNWFNYYNNSEGNYCIRVEDKLGCVTEECIYAFDPFNNPPYIDRQPTSCNLNRYYYNALGVDQGFIRGPQGNDDLQLDGIDYYVNVAIVGYKDLVADLSGGSCFESFQITTPFFEGLQDVPTATNATCITCTDAQITYNVDGAADCIDCVYGEVGIFDIDFNNVTSDNDNGMLGVGEYYVAALDQNTGCFIASHSIEIISN